MSPAPVISQIFAAYPRNIDPTIEPGTKPVGDQSLREVAEPPGCGTTSKTTGLP